MTSPNMQEAREIAEEIVEQANRCGCGNCDYCLEVDSRKPIDLVSAIADALSSAEARGRLAGLEESEKAVLEEKVNWDGQNESDKTYNMAIDHAVIAIRSRQRSSNE